MWMTERLRHSAPLGPARPWFKQYKATLIYLLVPEKQRRAMAMLLQTISLASAEGSDSRPLL